MKVKTGIGLDSHRFVEGESNRPLVLGGLVFRDAPALSGNSDADVILHAVTDAISGVTGRTVIGAVADAMCQDGITDSKAYLKVALKDLGSWQISHLSLALECLRPKIDPKVPALRQSLADLLGIA
ncbi:MAG TPA: 2-C-methyl-D-erythritol 2,4-cyclodiphosphate synthase, partial [Opitutae bacterium]|nr:2-C-methyl-D-erythritol 2,4-cyclodiphosphate synthase [Opitutae bacterium]